MSEIVEPRVDGVSHVDLISAIGHELRNIVGPIVHQIELMEHLDLDEPLRARSRRAIIESASELNRFIDGIADLERLERGEHSQEPIAFDLDVLLDDLLDLDDDLAEHGAGSAAVAALAGASSGGSSGASTDGADDARPRIRTGERAGWVVADPVSIRRVIGILASGCEARFDGAAVAVRRSEDSVDLTFCRPGCADDTTHRAVTVDDGLLAWVASVLAAQSGAEVRADSAGGSFRLRLPTARL